jgi:hypothetical protein
MKQGGPGLTRLMILTSLLIGLLGPRGYARPEIQLLDFRKVLSACDLGCLMYFFLEHTGPNLPSDLSDPASTSPSVKTTADTCAHHRAMETQESRRLKDDRHPRKLTRLNPQ